jgi:hypothetical protein
MVILRLYPYFYTKHKTVHIEYIVGYTLIGLYISGASFATKPILI